MEVHEQVPARAVDPARQPTGEPGPVPGQHASTRRAPRGPRLPEVRLAPARPLPGAPVLDAEQRQVVDHRDGHLLVLAGPGTGKTTTLAELIVDRVRTGTRADRVLALTFGRRAAGELAERVAGRLGTGPQPVVATFHSYAFGLVRQHADPGDFQAPPRLLTAAEQDARVSELLTHAVREGRLPWPSELAGAVGTRGLAEQVRLLMARARAQGLDGRALARLGRADGVPAWVAVGRFLEEYLDTLGWEPAMDYDDLIVRATGLAAGTDPAGRRIASGLSLIVVDEYQDTDPAQVRLLRHLARGGAQVVAVGDPDQAIYGFRGADVGGLLDFPAQFPDPAGRPARIVVLRTARRFPRPISTAAHGVLGPVPIGRLPAWVQRTHRHPQVRDEPAEVSVRTYPSAAAEAAGIAEHLIRAHAGMSGTPALAWSQMAVLVRNPAVSAAAVVRALRQADIPVGVPVDELALAAEPVVDLLTTVLTLALPGAVPAESGAVLLRGPLGRIDPITVRALARAALQEQAGAPPAGDPAPPSGDSGPRSGPPSGPPSGSAEALTEALRAGRTPAGVVAPPGYHRVRSTLAATRAEIARGATVSEVLWAAWSATDWPQRLQAAALRPVGASTGSGGVSSGAAHRDLDAAMALFEVANRLPRQVRGAVGVRAFLDQVAAHQLAAQRGAATTPRDEVRVLSAHRSKGLEWDLVVVAGVQEGLWPDIRLRSDVLATQSLGPSGRQPPVVSDLLAEERRLLYVACTRARSALLVTAVHEPAEGGAQPSRLLADLGVPVEEFGSRRRSPVRAGALITALRRAAAAPVILLPDGRPDPDVEALRAAAVTRLALLAERARAASTEVGHPLRAADPATWWGGRGLTAADPSPDSLGPLAPPGQGPTGAAPAPLVLSPSAVESLLTCPLRWFLERRAGAGSPSTPAMAVGTLVHALARAVAEGEVAADLGTLEAILDEVWSSLPFPARYQQAHERRRVSAMLAAFLAWHADRDGVLLGTEVGFEHDLVGGDRPIRLRGTVDRLDRLPDGSVRVVDYKTSRQPVSVAAAAENPQLGVYQAVVAAGGIPTATAPAGGGELVYLAATDRKGLPKLRTQPALQPADRWVVDLVAEAGRLAAGPGYPARVNAGCRRCDFQSLCPAQGRATVAATRGGTGPRGAPATAGVADIATEDRG